MDDNLVKVGVQRGNPPIPHDELHSILRQVNFQLPDV